MKIPRIPIQPSIIITAHSLVFIIFFLGYYLDGRPRELGVCAIIMGLMLILGLFILPSKKARKWSKL